MPTTWKNTMIEQGLNYVDYTVKEMFDFFETRVENLELKEDKKKSSTVANILKNKKSTKKSKPEDANSSVVEFSGDFSMEHKPI